MKTVSLSAYAKINLFLEVCEKRTDSYHNIDSIMQSVTLRDVITVTENKEIKLSNDAGLPNDESNLCYKAAKAFFSHTGITAGAEIRIKKNIPISAGLAGGSADAAAVLKALNRIYEANLSVDTLCEIGAELGADIPFCIRCGTFVTKGIGDIMIPCSPLPDCIIVIAKAGDGVSTPFAYGEIDRLREASEEEFKRSDTLAETLKSGDLNQSVKQFYNSFEKVVCPIRPKVEEQKKILIDNNALFAMMSGSGPSVFGIFDNISDAENALDQLKEYGSEVHLCRPYN